VVHRRTEAVHPKGIGTKAAAYYLLEVPARSQITICLRLYADDQAPSLPLGREFQQVFNQRMAEADAFYAALIPESLSAEGGSIVRRVAAGLLWSKQFYPYVVRDWPAGAPVPPPPPASRKQGRNADWGHLFNRDVLSMPDKWEYPWYAAWDLAFHMLP